VVQERGLLWWLGASVRVQGAELSAAGGALNGARENEPLSHCSWPPVLDCGAPMCLPCIWPACNAPQSSWAWASVESHGRVESVRVPACVAANSWQASAAAATAIAEPPLLRRYHPERQQQQQQQRQQQRQQREQQQHTGAQLKALLVANTHSHWLGGNVVAGKLAAVAALAPASADTLLQLQLLLLLLLLFYSAFAAIRHQT